MIPFSVPKILKITILRGGEGSGDVPGHDFRGNQWTKGEGGGSASGEGGGRTGGRAASVEPSEQDNSKTKTFRNGIFNSPLNYEEYNAGLRKKLYVVDHEPEIKLNDSGFFNTIDNPMDELLQKINISRLSESTNIPERDVSKTLKGWNTSSNFTKESILFQKAASEQFDLPFSEWQNTLKVPNEDVSQRRILSQKMYDNTQADLSRLGFSPGDTIRLYRGVTTDSSLGVIGDKVNYNGNLLESWSLDRSTADEFTKGIAAKNPLSYGSTFAMDVPVENIFSTSRNGLGFFDVQEIVIFGGLPGTSTIITTNSGKHQLEESK